MTIRPGMGLRRAVTLLGLTCGLICFPLLWTARASAPPCRFVVSNTGTNNNTVYDNVTGLTWQQTIPQTTSTWTDAMSYCQSLSYGGFSSGWRVPSTKELLSIVDLTTTNPCIDQTYFPNTPSNYFWSSSPWREDAGSLSIWVVGFSLGNAPFYGSGSPYYVRCVR